MVRFVPGKISTRKAHRYALHFQFNLAQLKLDSDAIQTKLYLYMQSFFLWKLLLWIFFTISASNILYNRPPQTSVLLHCGNSPWEKLVFLRKSLSQRRRTMVCGEVSLKKVHQLVFGARIHAFYIRTSNSFRLKLGCS